MNTVSPPADSRRPSSSNTSSPDALALALARLRLAVHERLSSREGDTYEAHLAAEEVLAGLESADVDPDAVVDEAISATQAGDAGPALEPVAIVVAEEDPVPAPSTPDLRAMRRERLRILKEHPGWTGLSKSGKKVIAYAISGHYSAERGFFVSKEKLSRKTGVDRATVYRQLGKAEVSGLLVKQPRARPNGSTTSSAYFVAIDAPDAVTPVANATPSRVANATPCCDSRCDPACDPQKGSLKGTPFEGLHPQGEAPSEGTHDAVASVGYSGDDVHGHEDSGRARAEEVCDSTTTARSSSAAPSDEEDLDAAWLDVENAYPGASRYRAGVEAYAGEFWVPLAARDSLVATLEWAAGKTLDGIEWAAA
jgi:hypothetical protein